MRMAVELSAFLFTKGQKSQKKVDFSENHDTIDQQSMIEVRTSRVTLLIPGKIEG